MNARNWRTHIGAALATCLLAGAAAAQAPGKALLLVAAPSLQGPYRQTTLVAVQVGETHLGFILNRASGVKLSALFPDQGSAAASSEEVYFGGPVQSESLFAMLRRDPGGPSLPLFGGLFVTGKADAIRMLIAKSQREVRFFAGFVGWTAGELEKEIGLGVWQVAVPNAELVFRQDTSGMWEELSRGLGNQLPPKRGQIHAGPGRDAPCAERHSAMCDTEQTPGASWTIMVAGVQARLPDEPVLP